MLKVLLSGRNKKYVKKRFIDKYIFFMVIIFIYNGIYFWIRCVKIQITSYFLYIRSSSLIYSRCSCVSFSHSCLFLPLWIQTPLLFICLIYSLFFLFSFFWLITGEIFSFTFRCPVKYALKSFHWYLVHFLSLYFEPL